MSDEELFQCVLKMHEQNPKAYDLWSKGKSSLGFAVGQTVKIICASSNSTFLPRSISTSKIQLMIVDLWKELDKKPV